MVYIDKVHYIIDAHGCEVIGNLKWTNSLTESAANECTKKQMIDFINNNPNVTNTKYYRNGLWITGENVRVVDNNYLRTDNNKKLADNLGELPRY